MINILDFYDYKIKEVRTLLVNIINKVRFALTLL